MRTAADFVAQNSNVIKRGTADKSLIRSLLIKSDKKDADAQRIENSADTRLTTAYDAILCCALAILSAQGYKCSAGEGHHADALEAACAALEIPEANLREIQALRRIRNSSQYGATDPSDADVKLAVEWARRIRERTAAYMTKNHAALLK